MRSTLKAVACAAAMSVTLFAASAIAAQPLLSFSIDTNPMPCGPAGSPTGDDRVPLDGQNFKMPPATPGSGVFPTEKFWVRKVTLCHIVASSNPAVAHAEVGHSGPNGDLLLAESGSGCQTESFDVDAAPLFTPGEYFDIHANCNGANGSQWFVLLVYYELAS